MTFLALVCDCNLDAGQESYDLEEFHVLVGQNIERTPIKLKVGNLQATKFPGPLYQENSMRQMLLPKGRMGKLLRVDWEFLSPTVGMP